ncbi:hypothetical protein D9M68_529400 [compost metagenome]
MTWPACGMVTAMSFATSGSRPMMTNSPVPMAKPPTPNASTARRNWADETDGAMAVVSAPSRADGEAFKAGLLGGCPADAGKARF